MEYDDGLSEDDSLTNDAEQQSLRNPKKMSDESTMQLVAETVSAVEARRTEARRREEAALNAQLLFPTAGGSVNSTDSTYPPKSGFVNLNPRLPASRGIVVSTNPVLPPPSERICTIRIQHDLTNEPKFLGRRVNLPVLPDFHSVPDARVHRSILVEDMDNLAVCSASFNPGSWLCVACNNNHALLPRKRNLSQWAGGRKVIFLTDQDFPAVLPSTENKCPIIVRREGGSLTEIGDTFCKLLGEFAVPEGSIILVSSLSQLRNDGLSAYIESIIREGNRFKSMFRSTVTVLPFVPLPLLDITDPVLVQRMMELSLWLDTCEGYCLQELNEAFRCYILASDGPYICYPPSKQRLPLSLHTGYTNARFVSPGWLQLPASLSEATADNEQKLINILLSGVSNRFKMDLDVLPSTCRDLLLPSSSPTSTASADTAIIIGGSNAERLASALANLGLESETITNGGWSLKTDDVTHILPLLESLNVTVAASAPVIIYGMDNGCFMAADKDGIQTNIGRLKDGKYHVIGELSVAPDVALAAAIANLKRLIAQCGERRIFVITPLGRYLNMGCCADPSHCTHLDIPDSGLKITCDLFRLRNTVSKRLEDQPNCTVVSAGDLLVGSSNAAPSDILTASASWGAVHGGPAAYTRMGMSLLSRLEESSLKRRHPGDNIPPAKVSASSAATGPLLPHRSFSFSGSGFGQANRGNAGFQPRRYSVGRGGRGGGSRGAGKRGRY